MYGIAQQEAWRQSPEEIRREVAHIRLEKTLRVNREGRFRLMGDTRWELERYAGLLGQAAPPLRVVRADTTRPLERRTRCTNWSNTGSCKRTGRTDAR